MPVSIIGTRGSGKRTFIDLFYQTMVYFDNDPQTRGQIKYYLNPEDNQRVHSDINGMMAEGSFPPPVTRSHKVSTPFVLGFSPRGHGLGQQAVHGGVFGGFLCMGFELFDLCGEDLAMYIEHHENEPLFQRIFNCNVMILLIDCSKFTRTTTEHHYHRMLQYDRETTMIISSLIHFRHDNVHGGNQNAPFYPIIVFTKCDALEPELIKSHNLGDILKIGKDNKINYSGLIQEINSHPPNDHMHQLKDITNKLSMDLLQEYMPQTNAMIRGSRLMAQDLQETQYFWSWVGSEREGEGLRIKTDRLKYSNEQTYESPVYSRHMYVALLNYLRDITEKSPDSDSKIAELFGDE